MAWCLVEIRDNFTFALGIDTKVTDYRSRWISTFKEWKQQGYPDGFQIKY